MNLFDVLRLVWLSGSLALAFAPAEPRVFSGTVANVYDGDTLALDAVSTAGYTARYRVRLAGIDAPELRQPGGIAARDALRAAVDGKRVRVEWSEKDRYGRLVGTVKSGDGKTDLCERQVETGNAWVYRAYPHPKEYESDEAAARKDKRGLWAAERPIAPWDWRKGKR